MTDVYMGWRTRARCRDVDPDLLYPVHDAAGTGAAKAICRPCPVKAECLAYALEHDEQHGVWGGMTPAERRNHKQHGQAITHVAPRVACPTCGRALTLWRGTIRRHNWVDDVRGWVRCPGAGRKP